MPERFSHPNFDRVAGKISASDAAELKEKISSDLEIGGDFIESIELNKTERDEIIIDFVTNSVDEILSRYGREKIIPIDHDHIHVLPEGGVERVSPNIIEGGHDNHLGSVIVDRFQSDLDFARTLFHELVHMKSYKALQVTTDGELAKYRGGWSVVSRDGSINYFNALEEAAIDYLTEKFYREYLTDAPFVGEAEKLPEYKTNRSEERAMLNDIVNTISERSGRDESEVLDMFIRAQVTGNFLEIGKIIEKHVGEGAFRELGQMTGSNGEL